MKKYSDAGEGMGAPVMEDGGSLRISCPNRFREGQLIATWVGETLLGTSDPLVVGEVGFLQSESKTQTTQGTESISRGPDDVGRIDSVLMHPDLDQFQWCAVELQAVYFSGGEMGVEFKTASSWQGVSPPFPAKLRRPDYRSSGPKRLMPQLQIKVPTLRRWGKKMAVVVDEAFFSALGKMEAVPDASNADIAWFVVKLDESTNPAKLVRSSVHFTTLERAVEGLTAGTPVTLSEFEKRIRKKINVQQRLKK